MLESRTWLSGLAAAAFLAGCGIAPDKSGDQTLPAFIASEAGRRGARAVLVNEHHEIYFHRYTSACLFLAVSEPARRIFFAAEAFGPTTAAAVKDEPWPPPRPAEAILSYIHQPWFRDLLHAAWLRGAIPLAYDYGPYEEAGLIAYLDAGGWSREGVSNRRDANGMLRLMRQTGPLSRGDLLYIHAGHRHVARDREGLNGWLAAHLDAAGVPLITVDQQFFRDDLVEEDAGCGHYREWEDATVLIAHDRRACRNDIIADYTIFYSRAFAQDPDKIIEFCDLRRARNLPLPEAIRGAQEGMLSISVRPLDPPGAPAVSLWRGEPGDAKDARAVGFPGAMGVVWYLESEDQAPIRVVETVQF